MGSRTQSYLMGLVFGSIVGATTALMMAPRSGKETQNQVREQAVELRGQAEASYAKVQTRLDEKMSELRANLDRIAARLDRAVVESRATLAEHLTQVAGEIAPE